MGLVLRRTIREGRQCAAGLAGGGILELPYGRRSERARAGVGSVGNVRGRNSMVRNPRLSERIVLLRRVPDSQGRLPT